MKKLTTKIYWIFCVFCFLLLTFQPKFLQAEIIIQNATSFDRIRIIRSEDASFGQLFPEKGFLGRVIAAEPLTACKPIKPAPRHDNSSSIHHWIVLIARYGGCNFQDKIMRATEANFSAAIVYNINSDRLIPMGGSGDFVPSTFIGHTDGAEIHRRYTYNMTPLAQFIILPEDPFDINTYLLPFAIVVGICFLIMLAIVIFKCVQDHRRSRRNRLPKSALKRLPIIKFQPGQHPYETCCICLEDYVVNDKLRILPCDHAYHKTCIDPWLVQNKRVCPQCRKRVFSNREQDSDDSNSDSETTPLITGNRRAPTATSGSTFQAEGTFAAAVIAQSERRRRNFLSRLRSNMASINQPEEDRSVVEVANNDYVDNENVETQEASNNQRRPSAVSSTFSTSTSSSSTSGENIIYGGPENDDQQDLIPQDHVAIIHSFFHVGDEVPSPHPSREENNTRALEQENNNETEENHHHHVDNVDVNIITHNASSSPHSRNNERL